MFDEKSFSFEDITLKKGLERLLPNLSEEKQDMALAIVGYVVINNLESYRHGEKPDFYHKLEVAFNMEDSEVSLNTSYLATGKKAKNILFEELKGYTLGLNPDKRKVAKYRQKELEFLSRLI